jgi:endonuclease/exonuclease/phosphatase family metal-dependent hydrolase
VLTIANFNMHTGIDGWGRPFDYLEACRSLEADILVLQEVWADAGGAAGGGQAGEIATELGYQVVAQPLAEGYRIIPQADATARWMPFNAFAERNKSLYFDSVRPIAATTLSMERLRTAERGIWSLAVLVRNGLALEASRVLDLPTLRRDRTRRAAIVVDLTVDGVALSVIGTHMAHLSKGSVAHFRQLRPLLATEARPTAVLVGDMNLWGPPVRYFLRGWRRAVRGATWPSWRPHSQIDHILVRGDITAVSGQVLPDAGSDHRPVRAVLSLG